MKPPKTADELRKSFLDFFESKDHLTYPSSSLIPSGDPTLSLSPEFIESSPLTA